jgi:hypothetical protein
MIAVHLKLSALRTGEPIMKRIVISLLALITISGAVFAANGANGKRIKHHRQVVPFGVIVQETSTAPINYSLMAPGQVRALERGDQGGRGR